MHRSVQLGAGIIVLGLVVFLQYVIVSNARVSNAGWVDTGMKAPAVGVQLNSVIRSLADRAAPIVLLPLSAIVQHAERDMTNGWLSRACRALLVADRYDVSCWRFALLNTFIWFGTAALAIWIGLKLMKAFRAGT